MQAMMDWAAVRTRIASKIAITHVGCWDWTGSIDDGGYPRINFRGKNKRVGRITWCAHHEEEWPTGKYALHSCDNPRCVNPDHIRPGTLSENMVDACVRMRQASVRKTHCPKDHPYSPDNTAYYSGSRRCRECHRTQTRLWMRLAKTKQNRQETTNA